MKRFGVFVVLAMVLICSSAAQSVSNDAQKIIGTWVETSEQKTTYVFNANGTGTLSGANSLVDGNFFWGISQSSEIVIYFESNQRFSHNTCFFSPDGRTMILGKFSERYEGGFFGLIYQKK